MKHRPSRQYLRQKRQLAQGLCILCSDPIFKGWECEWHYAMRLLRRNTKSPRPKTIALFKKFRMI